ncbi:uncharacterized protein LOC133388973 [Rhineura floridana]|uniref:uncharacterized protein LOC133388973 n=1 Tax=Rhineura floridana TaxID=261503 RepID=UPI002AC83C66|nr:uncharacterized protein LOC133388973 [Rhineura floridana]
MTKVGPHLMTKRGRGSRKGGRSTNGPAEMALVSWNVRGMQTRAKREEILTALKSSGADVVVLQETWLATDRQRSHTQRWWHNIGPSFWSYEPTGRAGVTVLFRVTQGHPWHVDRVQEAEPGHLLMIDFSLPQPGSSSSTINAEGSSSSRSKGTAQGQKGFRLCAPTSVAGRRKLWRLLHLYGDTSKELMVAGAFHNRSRPADRWKGTSQQPQASHDRALTGKETLNKWLDGKGLADVALAVPNSMGFIPPTTEDRKRWQQQQQQQHGHHQREAEEEQPQERIGRAIAAAVTPVRMDMPHYTCRHPSEDTVNCTDRAWMSQQSWAVTACRIMLSVWSTHATIGVGLRRTREHENGREGEAEGQTRKEEEKGNSERGTRN